MTDRRERRRRGAWNAAVIAIVGAALAACGQAAPSSSFGVPLPVTASPPPSEAADTFEVPSFELETDPPEPTDSDTGSPGTPPCAIEDLKASRGITEVDGDERITEVVLVAAGTCSIDAYPTLALEDARDRVLVDAAPSGTGGIDLVGGVAYTSEIRLSNWCLGEPAYPVGIGIRHGNATVRVSGDSFPDEGDLPACVFEDADPVLSGSAWQPTP